MLDKYLKRAADILRNGGRVYLCPAAMETVILAKVLQREYSVLPTGFCDNDAKKQGKFLNSLTELRIFSFDDALAEDGARFLIVSPHHSAEIMGDLLFNRGVPEERILNYQPLERRKTCSLFAQNWIIEDRHFVCCCIEEYKPRLDNQKLDVKKGLDYLDTVRRGWIDGSIPLADGCRNCFHNKDSYIFVSRKLNSFDFSFRGWCNYKCAYCSSNRPDKSGYNDRFSLEAYLTELERRGMANDIFSVLFAVGESCLNEKRFSLYEHCREKQYFLDVFTNCSVFDQSLFDVARTSPVIIRKSFDAGTAETYAKIKGVDCFPKVLENAWRYLEAPYLALNPKYLFVPGINDNETDIRRFVDLCAELKVDLVTPVFSFLDSQFFDSEHAKRMFGLLVAELEKNNIMTANVDTLYSESYHKVYAESFGK